MNPLILPAFVAALLIGWGAMQLARAYANPVKRERKRRLKVHREGRLGDALITEVTPETIFYSYEIRGVQYTASQDIRGLAETLPAPPRIGESRLKFLPRNPANSILVCEEWSGLTSASPKG